MKPYLLLLLCIALTASVLPAQKAQIDEEGLAILKEMEDTLSFLSYTVINDSVQEDRFKACRAMIPRLVKALKVEHSFDYPFDRLSSVSIQYPQDSSFRVFTWQLYVDENTYRYYGAIQLNTPQLKLFPLRDRSDGLRNPEQQQLSPDQWYGAVYYNILEGDGHYLLFGFDGYELFRKRKVIDVLWFDDEGQPQLGAPVFVHEGNKRKHRIVREYTAAASTLLNYDENLEMIIFDHLIPREGTYGEGLTFYPDGSYEGYEPGPDGTWMHIEKVFNQVSEEAPRPKPVLDGDNKKDIFGRDRNR
ncbi:MAG TPA: hypothetical protein VJ933_02535 [Phaeodactylibacter sp.]|nr:hypothetical protein [Phaeodactylibacter sp.]